MGNSIAEARNRSHSSPRISFARKFRGSTASARGGNNHNDSDSSSRGVYLRVYFLLSLLSNIYYFYALKYLISSTITQRVLFY